MNQQVRIQKIQEVIDRNRSNPDLLKEEIMWEGALKAFPVYQIPLAYLVYNKYNGRILSRTKSLETQNRPIDIESDEGRNLVEQLLFDSKRDRNKKTKEDLKLHKQKKSGIITKDGVIIDGNRRAMLLNSLDRTGTFKAIILPVTLEENPIEIEKLETTYQMGEDEKLGYNPIEKYLKSKQLYDKLIAQVSTADAIKSIAEWMGESESVIEKYLFIMKVMDEYLVYLQCDRIYTQLDEREDQFIFLTKWLTDFYDKESKKAFDGYQNDDVDDLKAIAFDYLRFRTEYDGKEFRYLAEGLKEKHFFGDRELWVSFLKRHNEILRLLPLEPVIDVNSNNLDAHLNDRNKQFFVSSKFGNDESAFIENLDVHKTKLHYNRQVAQPEKLVKEAIQAFRSIKQGHRSFSAPEVQDLVFQLSDDAFKSLLSNSPSRVLDHVIQLMQSISVTDIPESEVDEVRLKTKQIQKIGYDLNKSL